MRSNDTAGLLKVEERILGFIKEAVTEENRRWNAETASVEIKLIGDRPAGILPQDSAIVQTTRRAITRVAARAAQITLAGSSTDFNIAMALGIPAVTLAGGGEGGNWAFAYGMVQADGRVSRAAGHFTHAVDVGGRRRREPADAACESGEGGMNRQIAHQSLDTAPRAELSLSRSSSRALC